MSKTLIKKSLRDDLQIELSEIGGSLYRLIYKGVTMTKPDSEDEFFFDQPTYYGRFISPFAGRIDKGRVGDFTFECNEGDVALHSSNISSAFIPLTYQEDEIDEGATYFARLYEYQGVRIMEEIGYRLYEDEARLDIDYRVRSSKSFPLNPTNHIYWTLGEEDLNDVKLFLPAKRIMRYGEKKLPLEFIEAEIPSPLDLENYYDNAFELSNGHVEARGRRFAMSVDTNAKAVVVFNGIPNCFTLEFMNNPLLGDACLKESEVAIHSEYRFKEVKND